MPETLVREGAAAARSASPQPRFACTWHTDVGVGWVHVAGELDLAAAPQLAQALRKAQLHARVVVLDLRELAFMDSAGLHVIVDAGIRARDCSRMIVVRGPAEVDALFMLTGTADDVEMCDLHPTDPPVQALLQLIRHPTVGARWRPSRIPGPELTPPNVGGPIDGLPRRIDDLTSAVDGIPHQATRGGRQ